MIRPARLLVVLVMLMAVSLTLSTAAWAHPRPAASPADDEATPAPVSVAVPAPVFAPSAPTPLVPGLVLGVGIAAVLASRRRGLIGLFSLVLIVLAVETGVHSVHHLADQQGAAECVVALATAQVHATVEPPPHVHDLRLDVSVGSVAVPSAERPGARSSRPDEGRAPPVA